MSRIEMAENEGPVVVSADNDQEPSRQKTGNVSVRFEIFVAATMNGM
jgi:hypothetical protein